MKNQYFGDINDYRKYGLLRCIIRTTDLKLLVAWMLTPNDGTSDGKSISYLKNPEEWKRYDPDLFDTVKNLLEENKNRTVQLIEESNILPGTDFYTKLVPDSRTERPVWFESLTSKANSAELIFLDPDNGLEVKSRLYGRKHSSKYIYWHEIEALWKTGNSLIIYQHFPREKRTEFISRIGDEFGYHTPGSKVEAFITPRVLFLLALQGRHAHLGQRIIKRVGECWDGKGGITVWREDSPKGGIIVNKAF